ncbi:hypothetical protein LOC68_16645 [Blastopirellula sp. JC732]|uniref:Uncharacterized protein n=1 Tax=Blastopirellula sediminis TaxID=2894196 RepID=A0A9X1MQ87_9BACT|nr:hypothetical protein [Blastopirellula sediminis]MCC9606681.1 hypothetical protein [Blastopirellula sediminis]MCC9630022.1 hypothetical protein [Blastopirellula sediminis]
MIALIAVALAIGRFIGLKGSLAFICVSGFVVPALVGNLWIRAALAFGLTGIAIFALHALLAEDGARSLSQMLYSPIRLTLFVGVGALLFSSRLRWGYCHPTGFSRPK